MATTILIVFLAYAFITTCSYAFFEIYSEKNKIGGIVSLFIAVAGVVLPILGILL